MVANTFVRILGAGLGLLAVAAAGVQALEYEEVQLPECEAGELPLRLTDAPVNEFCPSWSPDGSQIVFGSNLDGDYELYRIPASPTPVENWEQLTYNSYFDGHAQYSHDGTKIAWSRDVFAIGIMNADGSGSYDAFPRGSLGDVYHPRWSVDDSTLYFISDRGHYAQFEIWKVPSGGGTPTQITNSGAHHEYPSVHPLGGFPFVCSVDVGGRSDHVVDPDIYLVESDGSEHPLIAWTGIDQRGPEWSPDGSKIAFVSTRDGQWDLWLADADGTNPVNLTGDWDGNLLWGCVAWSPDGTQIAFSADEFGNYDLYVLCLPGPSCVDDADCDDGAWCNGAEMCDVDTGLCLDGTVPCAEGEICDEDNDVCLPACTQDAHCDDGLFCNGAETCVSGLCEPGADPCPGQSCDEAADACVGCPIVFQDDFTGTTIDTTKWDVSVVMNYDPDTPAPQYGSYGQDDALWFEIYQQNIARGHAVTRRTFGEQDNTVEVEVWQDDISGWQDWPIHFTTHLGSFGYYNAGWHWTVEWLDSQGVHQLQYGFALPAATPWTKYRMKMQLQDGILSWHLDLDDGEGYRLVHSTTDFSLPFDMPWVIPSYFERIVLSSTDIGTTFYDNVVVSRCTAGACMDDTDCDDGLFCNGPETCVDGSCQGGADPCPGQGCDESTDTCEPTGCGTLLVQVNEHRPGGGGSTIVGIEGLELCVFDKSPGSCVRDYGVSHRHYPEVFNNCDPVACGLTDADGAARITLEAGDYVIIGEYDPDGYPPNYDGDERYIGVSASDFQCAPDDDPDTVTMHKHIQVIILPNGRTVGVDPRGGRGGRSTTSELVEITNVDGADDSISVITTNDDLYPTTSGYTAVGSAVVIDSSLSAGELFMTVLVAFDADDLGGADPLSVNLAYNNGNTGNWRLAVAGNTQPSPGYEPYAIGDRLAVTGDTIPALSDELGDYGVFWNPTAGQGFVWANVDYASEFAAGYIAVNDPIPTVSQWGLIVMVLALLTMGKIYFERRRAAYNLHG